MSISRIHAIAFGGAAAITGFISITDAHATGTITTFRSQPVAASTYTQQLQTSTATGGVNFALAYNSLAPITIETDFVVPPSTYSYNVSAQFCRQAWSGTTAACGTASTATYTATGSTLSHQLSPSPQGVQAATNSNWDYYYVGVTAVNGASGGPATVTPAGVGILCW